VTRPCREARLGKDREGTWKSPGPRKPLGSRPSGTLQFEMLRSRCGRGSVRRLRRFGFIRERFLRFHRCQFFVGSPGALVLGFATFVRFTLTLGEGIALFSDKSRAFP
jgi:hypothetical protein